MVQLERVGDLCSAGDLGSIPGLGRPPGTGKGYPLQYPGLENSMDYIVDGVAKSQTRLSNFHFHHNQRKPTCSNKGLSRAKNRYIIFKCKQNGKAHFNTQKRTKSMKRVPFFLPPKIQKDNNTFSQIDIYFQRGITTNCEKILKRRKYQTP